MKTLKSSLKVDFNDVTADFIHEVYKKITDEVHCSARELVTLLDVCLCVLSKEGNNFP